MHRWSISLSDKQQADLERLRLLLDQPTASKTIGTAIRFVLAILDRQEEGYKICLKKDGQIVEVEILF